MNTRIHLSYVLEFAFAATFVVFNWLSEINALRTSALVVTLMICIGLALPIFMRKPKPTAQQGAENIALIALATNLLLQTPWMSGWGDFHFHFAVAFTLIAWVSYAAGRLLTRPAGDWHQTLRRQQRFSHS